MPDRTSPAPASHSVDKAFPENTHVASDEAIETKEGKIGRAEALRRLQAMIDNQSLREAIPELDSYRMKQYQMPYPPGKTEATTTEPNALFPVNPYRYPNEGSSSDRSIDEESQTGQDEAESGGVVVQGETSQSGSKQKRKDQPKTGERKKVKKQKSKKSVKEGRDTQGDDTKANDEHQ